MRAKINGIWYDANDTEIHLELNEMDKHNIRGMSYGILNYICKPIPNSVEPQKGDIEMPIFLNTGISEEEANAGMGYTEAGFVGPNNPYLPENSGRIREVAEGTKPIIHLEDIFGEMGKMVEKSGISTQDFRILHGLEDTKDPNVCSRCNRPHFLRDEDAGSERHELMLCDKCYTLGYDPGTKECLTQESKDRAFKRLDASIDDDL